MSQARIRAAKEQQIELTAQIEETVVLIKKQQLLQTQTDWRIQLTKSQIAGVHENIAQTELTMANTNAQMVQVKSLAMTDALQYETANRSLKQAEYRSRLETQQIKLAEIQAVNSHQMVINGTEIKLLPPSNT